MLRSRYFVLLGLLMTFVVATAVAQEKKDPVKDPAPEVKKGEAKKEEPKKEEPKKTEPVKTEEPKKDETKKDEPKKVDAQPAGLAWRFTKDVPFYQQMNTSTEQNIKVMNLDVTQKQDQTFYFKWTPTEQDGDKWKIKQEIEGIKMTIDIAGNPVSFDSTNENATAGTNTALSEFFKNLKGSSFILTYNTKTMKVESVAGRDEFLKKLGTANPMLEPLLKKILSEDALKQMADPTFGFLPPPAKKADEPWDSTSTLNLGPIGTYTVKYKFADKGEDKANKDLELINVETTIAYAVPSDTDSSLPFKIKASNLKTTDKQEPGKIFFNKKLGRLESSEIKLALSGTLTIEIGGNTTTVELTQTQTINVKASDKSLLPVPEPKKGATP